MTFQSTGNNRLFWRALAISVVAHGILLAPQVRLATSDPAGTPLQATLRPLVEAAPAKAMPQSSSSAVPAKPRGRHPAADPATAAAHARDAPATVAAADMSRPALPQPAAVAASKALTTVSGARSVPFVPSQATAEGAPVAGNAHAGISGSIDPDGLREYRLALAREARRYRRDLERAVEAAGVDGTAQIRIELGSDGRVRDTRLAQSSGDRTLDAAAVAAFVRAAPHAIVPASLRGRAVPVTLPVVFRLKDE